MKTKQTDLLRLNLQYFSEEPPAEPPTPNEPPTPTYTQADIDRIVGERLAREKQKAEKEKADLQAEAERKRLEEESEFKTLYEAEKQAREQVERERQFERLEQTKLSLLVNAGYSSDRIPDVLALVVGDDEDAVKASVERIVKVAPPKALPIDPSTNNGGGRQQPKIDDGGYEAAREKARKLLKRK